MADDKKNQEALDALHKLQDAHAATSSVSNTDWSKVTDASSFTETANAAADNVRQEYTKNVDSNYISSFLKDSRLHMTSATSDKTRMGVTTSKSIYESRKKTYGDLHKRSYEISRYLEDNKDKIDEETYRSMKDYLDAFDKTSSQSIHSFYRNQKFYSQFKTQEDYDKYVAQKEEYEAKVNLDLDNAEKEIKDLEAKREEWYWNTDYDATNHRERVAFEKQLEELDNEITRKKQYLNQARHIQEGAKLSSVADPFSGSYDHDFRNLSKYNTTIQDSHSWWTNGTGDAQYEWINNQNGYRDSYEKDMDALNSVAAATTQSSFYVAPAESAYRKKGYDHLTKDEIAIYNYYYAKDGKDKAQEYLDSIQETLNYRKATEMYGELEDNTAQELIFGVNAGLDQFASGISDFFNTGDNYIPQSAVQMTSGMVREDLADAGVKLPDWMGGASLGQVGYDAITTSANMAPSILTSMAVGILNPVAGQVAGHALMGMSAAGGAYQEALNEGYDKNQARGYGLLVGASEIVMEKVLGGISALGGNALGKSLTQNLTNADTALKMIAKKLGGSMLSEFSEEYLQEVLTPVFKNLALGTHEDVKLFSAEALYSGILGALTAGIMEGPTAIAGEVSVYNTGKDLQKADVSAQRLADIGKTFSADTVAHQLAGKVNENTTAYAMGRLFNEIGATLTEQNVNDITNALVSKGMNESVARSNAEALAYVVEGGQLTDAQVAIIEANEVLAEAARTTLIDANTTWNQRSQNYNEVLKSLAQEKASRTNPAEAEQENTPASDKVDTQKEEGSETGSEAETAAPKVKSIATIEDGRVTVKMEDGTEVNVKESGIDPDDGVRIETIASIDGISTVDANFILNTLRVSPGTSAQVGSLGAKEAYKYGFYGFSQDHIAKHGVFANALTDTQRQAIYDTGRAARQKQVDNKNATVAKKKATTEKNSATGKVHFDGDRSALTERQNASLTAMERVAEVLGVQIHVFESQVNERGKRIGANGWYDPKDSSIHIDLHAGATGEGTMLFTLAHELTHHIRKWSPAKFKVLADFLMQEYGKKGVNVDALVREQMAKAKRSGRTISYDTAYEEVVADSMETMLSDGNVMKRLEKLKAQDKDLWHKIKRFIDDMAAKIRAAYKGMSPDSVEGRYVAEMGEAIYRLQELFTEGLVEASENFQSAEKNTTHEGGEVKFMSREIEDVTDETVRADLTDVFNGNNVTSRSYIPLTKTTPFAVRYITGYMADRPIIVDKKKAYFDMREDGKFKEDKKHHYHGMGVDGFIDALAILNDPEYAILEDKGDGNYHYAFISSNENGEELCIVFQMNVTKNVSQMNGYPGGYYNIDITEFVATDEWLEKHGVEPGTSYKDYLLSFYENSIVYDRSIHFEQMNKARNIDSESAGVAASYDNNRASKDMLTQPDSTVKNESIEAMDMEVDEKTESVVPALLFSERTWTESDYVQERNKAAKEIAKAIGVSEKKAKAYIDSVNSIAKMIAEDRVRLDYFSSPGRSSFVGNVEYGGSFDFSTLCKKRRLLTGTFTAIQKALPNTALTADEILNIRNRMKDAGLEVSCGLCYVEGSRANMGQFAKEFLKLYKKYYPDAWQPNMADVNTPDGIEWVRINHPECYEQYEYFWNHYGTMKPGDKNLFASQQKPKLYQLHTEYKGEILQKFKDDDNVEEKNLNGGIRLQSFSDFEIVHLIDTMQIIMDMSRVGLAGQAYTKVPDFAWALGDTGLKINLSLIAKGVDENGKLVFDDIEGMPIADAMKLRDRYSANVGTILVAFNDEQLMAAMADDRVDYIIPFHRSQWKKSQYGAMGLPAKTKDYTYMQNEKFIKPQYHEYRGRMVKDKATNYMPNEYWDFSKSGKENAIAYLEMCARNNKRPKFYKLLQNNGDGSYSLKADGSTDGYWKLLIDFKMYDNDGNGSPQMAVKPEFNIEEATRMLDTYSGGHSNFPVAQGIVDEFVKEYKDSHKGVKFSDRDYVAYDHTAILKESKVDEYLMDYASKDSPKYTKAYITYMSPSTFMRLTTDGWREREHISEQAGKLDAERLSRSKPGIYLRIDHDTGKVIGHEGRHRMSAMDNEGIYYVPVLLLDDSNDMGKTDIAEINLRGQFNEYESGTVKDAIPLSFENRDRVIKKFATQSSMQRIGERYGYNKTLRFSDRDADSVSNRSLLANALESVAQNDIERKRLQEYKEKISLINAEEENLRALNKQLRIEKDPKNIRMLQFEANQSANRINTYDRQLLRLEASKPLKDVLTREKKMAYDRGVQKGKEALEAYRERAEKKQQETIERYQESRKRGVENRQKTAMRQKIRKTIRDLDNILNRGDKKRNVKEDMKDFVADALASAEILFTDNYSNEDMVRNGVGTDLTPEEAKFMNEARAIMDELANLPTGYDGWLARQDQEFKLKNKLSYRMAKLKDVFVRERARLNKTQVSEVLGNLADSYGRLQNSEYAHVQGAYHESVHEYLKMLQEDVGGTIVKDMTLGQLEELYKAYTMVMTTVHNANRMFAENLNNTRDALANRVMFEVHEAGGEHGLWSKAADKLNSFSWNNEKPVYAFERIGSQTLKTLYGNIRKGQDGWAVDIQEANDFRMKMYQKYKHNTWDTQKTYKFTSSSGIDFELNLDQIMSLYAYSKRAQAHDHLLKGGFVFDGNTEVVVNKKGLKITYLNKNATAYNVSFEILENIISKLTPEQKAFVDDMQEYLSTTMGEKGNEVSMQLYGVKLFNEKFYFPLRSAGQYMEKAKEADMKQKQGQVNIANSGFSKAVKIKASNPVVLTGFMEVWAGHVNEMSMYHSFVLPMEDFRRVYNYSSPHMEGQQSASVNGVIQNAYGAAATDYIDRLYRDLNGGAITDNTAGPINKLMNLFKKGAVFASASVTIQQPSAIARASALVDLKFFDGYGTATLPKMGVEFAKQSLHDFAGAKKDTAHDREWAELKKYAPVAVIKEMGFFDTNMGRSATDFLTGEEYSGIKEKALALVKDESYRDELLSKAPALADEVAWCVIWRAVKRETKARNPKMDVKSEEFLKIAGDRFSEVIDKTQVYDSVLARSANMRSKDTGMKMATAFMAEPTTSINMVADALRKGKKGNKKQAARIIGSVVSSVILNSFLVAWVYAARDDDEDETYREKYLSSFVSGIIDGVNPMTYIPFLKDIVSIVQGYDIERSDMAVISDLWNAWKQLKNDDVSVWRKVEGFVGSICQIFGLPVKNIMRDVRSVFQAYDTIVHGEKNTTRGTAIAIVEGITGQKPSNPEQLYKARKAGDKEHAARVEGRYEDEKSANAAVRKAITDRYMDDELTMAQATMQLTQYAGMKADKAYWLMDGWKYKKETGSDDGYSEYNDFYEAVQTGKNLKAVIKTYTDNGVKMTTLSGQITSHFEDEYVQMSVAERANIKGYLLNAYEQCGVSRKTAEEKLRDWDFEAKHGVSYEEIVAEYKNGDISESTMRSILADKGYSKSDIEDKISDWNVYKIYGYDYSELDDAYRAGELSREEFRQAMIDNGTFPAKADQAIVTYDWMRDNAQYGLEYSDAGKYAHPIGDYGKSLADVGLDPDIYLEYKELKKGCKGVDADNDGTADSGTLRAAKFEMIDSLPITNDQKDALAAIDYGMKSIKRYAPWH